MLVYSPAVLSSRSRTSSAAGISLSTASDTVLCDALRSFIRRGEVVYLHGLESSPQGTKGTWLHENLGGMGVDLDTSVACRVLSDARAAERPLNHESEMDLAFAVPMERARARLLQQPAPQLIIGSSFGGAVLLRLMAEGSWQGPALFLACAGVALTEHNELPEGSRALLIHCPEDDVVPFAHSELLARSGGPLVHLMEVSEAEQPHRLPTILDNGVLASAICWLLQPLAAERGATL